MTHLEHKQFQIVRQQAEQFVDSSVDKILSRKSSLTVRNSEWLIV